MTLFLMFARHSPENCPGFNEKAAKAYKALFDNVEELLKKHGIRQVGGWMVPPEHLAVAVYDAPSLEAFQKVSMEPEILAMSEFSTNEYKIAISFDEMEQMLQRPK